jgi:hypothetical protein
MAGGESREIVSNISSGLGLIMNIANLGIQVGI